MKELFDQNGHLTEDALKRLIEGTLSETERMEVAEHLSFCDSCLARYTQLLTDEVQIEPQTDITLPVMRRLRKKLWNSTMRRYASAAAAVAIGGALWYSGVFDAMGKAMVESPAQLMKKEQESISIKVPKQSWESRFVQSVDDWSEKVLDAGAQGFLQKPLSQQIEQNLQITEDDDK